jgi:hypothetical protein
VDLGAKTGVDFGGKLLVGNKPVFGGTFALVDVDPRARMTDRLGAALIRGRRIAIMIL